jgi:hypothetical protein
LCLHRQEAGALPMFMEERMRRLSTPLIAALAALAFCAAPAAAQSESEPNNGIGSWNAVSGSHSGTLGAGDSDWWGVYLTGPTQASFNYSATGCGVEVNFLDTDGKAVVIGPSRTLIPGVPTTASFDVPVGTARYFLEVVGKCAQPHETAGYTFSISGGVTAGEAPPNPIATGEPNDFGAQAWGPIGGGTWYTGDFDTFNDRDWLGFYVTRTGPIDIEITNLGGGTGNQVLQGSLHDDAGQVGSSVNPPPNESAHIRTTVRYEPPNYPGRFWVQIAPNEPGQRWMVRLLPADLIVPPPTPTQPTPIQSTPTQTTQTTTAPVKSAACLSAEKSFKGFASQLRKAKRKLKKAKRRVAKRKARKRVRTLTRKRNGAANRVARRC